MKFIIGGAYQGKLDYAKTEYGVNDIFVCEGMDIDFSVPCIYGIEKFCLACVRQGGEAKDYFADHRSEWENSILICEDIFCGVVPIEADYRAWREMTGRLCAYLSAEADTVTRVFCGLPQRLK